MIKSNYPEVPIPNNVLQEPRFDLEAFDRLNRIIDRLMKINDNLYIENDRMKEEIEELKKVVAVQRGTA